MVIFPLRYVPKQGGAFPDGGVKPPLQALAVRFGSAAKVDGTNLFLVKPSGDEEGFLLSLGMTGPGLVPENS